MALFVPEDGVAAYRGLLDAGFRRSGAAVYAPFCPACRACRALRVPVAGFRPRRDQRRCAVRNRDLSFTLHSRGSDDERRALYARYQMTVHGGGDAAGADGLLEDGGAPGGELHARDAGGRLLAVSVLDRWDDALSSVYCYWEPEAARRGLGTAMALAELALAARLGLRWWYPGYWIADCPAMAYKARFGPAEILQGDLRDGDLAWRPLA